MLFFDGALGVAMFALWIFCIIDVITTPEPAIRNLPKLLWLVVVVLLLDVGSVVWLVAGRTWGPRTELAYKGNGGGTAAPGARGALGVPGARRGARPTNPDDDDEFLAGLKARAEEQRRRAREQGETPPPE